MPIEWARKWNKVQAKKNQFHRCFWNTFYDSRPKVFLKVQDKKKLGKSNTSNLQKKTFWYYYHIWSYPQNRNIMGKIKKKSWNWFRLSFEEFSGPLWHIVWVVVTMRRLFKSRNQWLDKWSRCCSSLTTSFISGELFNHLLMTELKSEKILSK